MIIVNDTVAVGDTLNTFPTIMSMLRQVQEPGRIYWTNPGVGALFPYDEFGAEPLAELPEPANERVIRISFHDFIWGRTGWERFQDGSFEGAALQHFGFSPDIRPRLKVSYPHDPSVPTYDFVLAPCVLNNAWKNMTTSFWQELADTLRSHLGASVCATGTSLIPPDSDLVKIEYDIRRFKTSEFAADNLTRYLNGVDYFWDEPLTRVAQLLKNVGRFFISVDSGPSHLMRAIGRPHLELYPGSMQVRHLFPEDVEFVSARPSVADVLRAIETLSGYDETRGSA